MTSADYRDAVKSRLGLTTNVFDTIIDGFVTASFKRLFPTAGNPLLAQNVDVTVDSFGEATLNLSSLTTPAGFSKRTEYSTGGAFAPVPKSFHQGTTLYVRGLPSNCTLKVFGVIAYTIATLPEHLEQAVIWYSMSEFYDYVASSASGYSIYSQTSGSRTVDNMRDEALYYESKAKVFLNEQAELHTS